MRILIISTNAAATNTMQELFGINEQYQFKQVLNDDEFMELSPQTYIPDAILLYAQEEKEDTFEWLQLVKMIYSDIPLIIISQKNTSLDYRESRKNGADMILFLPYDDEFLPDRLLDITLSKINNDKISLSNMQAVSLSDFDEKIPINFDLYVHLPSNKKTLKYRRSGSFITNRARKKIKKLGQRFYVKKSDLLAFYEYADKVYKERNDDSPYSQTKRALKAKIELHDVVDYLLDTRTPSFEDGKEALKSCNAIMQELEIMNSLTPEEIYNKIIEHTGQPRTIYIDSLNMSIYSALFGRILQESESNIEHLALSGLLHNIGFTQLPYNPTKLNPQLLAPQGKHFKDFSQYTVQSVLLLKNKKLQAHPEVYQIIEQHREKIDGSGFPHKVRGSVIRHLATISSMAYQFHELTSLQEKTASLMPLSALEKMVEDNLNTSLTHPHDLLTKIQNFISTEAKKYKIAS